MLPRVPPISVILITKDAAAHVERALRSVAWAEERIVVDCGSRDATVALAAPLATRVETHPWAGLRRAEEPRRVAGAPRLGALARCR